MKTRFLDKHYPVLEGFTNARQGTLTFARLCLQIKREMAKQRGEPCNWRIWSFRHPVHGRKWHCICQTRKARRT